MLQNHPLGRRNVTLKKRKKNSRKGKYNIEKKTKKAFRVTRAGNQKVGKSITRCEATFKGTGAVDVDDKGKK